MASHSASHPAVKVVLTKRFLFEIRLELQAKNPPPRRLIVQFVSISKPNTSHAVLLVSDSKRLQMDRFALESNHAARLQLTSANAKSLSATKSASQLPSQPVSCPAERTDHVYWMTAGTLTWRWEISRGAMVHTLQIFIFCLPIVIVPAPRVCTHSVRHHTAMRNQRCPPQPQQRASIIAHTAPRRSQ